jgi:hypothetical protein
MTVRLFKAGFEQSKKLVRAGKYVFDARDAWSEHQPSTRKENEFILLYGFDEYGKWHLGIDDEQDKNTKRHYKFPYGDFENVHRCGVLSAESRAGQYKHYDVEKAAARLHEMIDNANAGEVKVHHIRMDSKSEARSAANKARKRA